jgi:hypothetical protein
MNDSMLQRMDFLYAKINELFQQYRFYEALKCAKEFEGLSRKYFGSNTPDYAVSLT